MTSTQVCRRLEELADEYERLKSRYITTFTEVFEVESGGYVVFEPGEWQSVTEAASKQEILSKISQAQGSKSYPRSMATA